jgi:hypothetical protein
MKSSTTADHISEINKLQAKMKAVNEEKKTQVRNEDFETSKLDAKPINWKPVDKSMRRDLDSVKENSHIADAHQKRKQEEEAQRRAIDRKRKEEDQKTRGEIKAKEDRKKLQGSALGIFEQKEISALSSKLDSSRLDSKAGHSSSGSRPSPSVKDFPASSSTRRESTRPSTPATKSSTTVKTTQGKSGLPALSETAATTSTSMATKPAPPPYSEKDHKRAYLDSKTGPTSKPTVVMKDDKKNGDSSRKVETSVARRGSVASGTATCKHHVKASECKECNKGKKK